MSNEERADFRTRFKKGQAGNPNGRPKGRKNEGALLREVMLRPIRGKDGNRVRTLPKIVVAAEVCLNKALKGDIASFKKVMEMAERFKLMQPPPIVPEITEIRRIIVYPDPKAKEEEFGSSPGNV